MTSELDKTIIEKFKLPSVLEAVANTANTDLYHGPVYTDGRGEWLNCFDEGARQFDFVRAVQMLSDWFDEHAETCYFEDWSGCLVSHADMTIGVNNDYYEYFEIDRKKIANILLGRELAHHV